MQDAIDARALSKLKWRCRRGLLENDLFIERFFLRCADRVTPSQAQALHLLMELPDNDLLDLLLRRTEPAGDLAEAGVFDVLQLLRTPRDASPTDSTPIHSKERA